jgi:hypothetical protein
LELTGLSVMAGFSVSRGSPEATRDPKPLPKNAWQQGAELHTRKQRIAPMIPSVIEFQPRKSTVRNPSAAGVRRTRRSFAFSVFKSPQFPMLTSALDFRGAARANAHC